MSRLNQILPLIGIVLILLSCVSCSIFSGEPTRQPTEPELPEEEADSTGGGSEGGSATVSGSYASADIQYTDQELQDYALDLLDEGITYVSAVIDGITQSYNVNDWQQYENTPIKGGVVAVDIEL